MPLPHCTEYSVLRVPLNQELQDLRGLEAVFLLKLKMCLKGLVA
jgi:hypothetical protein